MTNKLAIITGGLGGIGLDIVKFFYNKNYNLIILDNKKVSEFSKKNINKSDHSNFVKYNKIDLSKPLLIKKLFFILKKKYSKIDVLINCAGNQHIDSVESFPDSKWENIIKVYNQSNQWSSNSNTLRYQVPQKVL